MTLTPVAPPTVTPIDLSGYPSSHRGFTGVSSFTYDSAMTYTELVDSIRRWIPQVLIPWIGDNFEGFEQSWADESDALQAYITSALTAQNATVNAAIAQAVQDFATANVDVTDPKMKAAVSTIGSQTRTYLDSLYGAGAMADGPLKTVLADPNTHTARDYLDTRYGYARGQLLAPPPSGDAATDTANLKQAISDAQAQFADLIIAPSPGGAIKNYNINAFLTWDGSRGSIRGRGHIALDFSYIPTSYSGPSLLVTGAGTQSGYSHMAAFHRLEGFRMYGHNTDTSTLDGIRFSDVSNGIDQFLVESLHLYGFHDGISFGDNAWSITFNKVAIANSHHMGLVLSAGGNTGECIAFENSSIYGSHNAGSTSTAVALYAPGDSNVEFRMIGGSLDYNDQEGRIEGGALSFIGVHIEDNALGPMFTYSQSGSITHVTFRDCAWDSSATGVRTMIHRILPTNTGGKITVNFEGDKGGVYPNTLSEWFHDDSNNETTASTPSICSTLNGFHIDGNLMLGQFYSLLNNGGFDTNAFVASPGVRGWVAGATGTWTIGAGGFPGGALKLVSSSSASAMAYQRVAVGGFQRRTLRIAARLMLTQLTSGSIQLGASVFGEDGTTVLWSGRIGAALSTVDSVNWTHIQGRLTLPKGAAYLRVELGSGSFVGTGLWDQVEVVPV